MYKKQAGKTVKRVIGMAKKTQKKARMRKMQIGGYTA